MSLYLGTEKINNINSQVASQGGGSVSLSDDLPQADGTANAGISTLASRADHVHPHDNTKLSLAGGDSITGEIRMGLSDSQWLKLNTNFTINTLDSSVWGNSIVQGFRDTSDVAGLLSTAKNGAVICFSRDPNIPLAIEVRTLKNETGTIAIVGNIDLQSNSIKNLADPTENTDAANKKYVDDANNIFIATSTTTYDKVKAAYNAGKAIFYKNIDVFCPLSFISDDKASFGNIDNLTAYTIKIDASNEWVDSTNTLVPTTRKINGKSLSSNIKLGHTYNTTLTSSGWTASGDMLTQTLAVSGLVATYNATPTIDIAFSQVSGGSALDLLNNKKSVANAWGKISGIMEVNTAANSITFTIFTNTAPTVDIPIRITTYD